MSIAGQLMRIQDWTPSFKPKVETPIIPVWVTLPDLPWHCYNKDYVSGLLLPVGKVLYLDSTYIQKTWGSKAKERTLLMEDSRLLSMRMYHPTASTACTRDIWIMSAALNKGTRTIKEEEN
ncbi:hypothetical protein KY284_008556 [Solanum tuberosum]|nr:hypothetical protein KY284_008556 [Solanum tuberosum]